MILYMINMISTMEQHVTVGNLDFIDEKTVSWKASDESKSYSQ